MSATAPVPGTVAAVDPTPTPAGSASATPSPPPCAPASAVHRCAPVLAEVIRSGRVEGRHHGSLVVLNADGSTRLALGDVTTPMYPRSSNKPMQAAALLRAGLKLEGPQLALAAASHSGEPFQLDLVRTMLAEHALDEEQLGTPQALPLDQQEAEGWLAAGRSRSRLAMNCSGKHAAMLAACTVRGWPLHSYLSPAHPLQREIRRMIEETSGEQVAHTATDGCGAPLMTLSLTGLARAFRRLVQAAPGSEQRRVADAMRAHPEYVAGTRRTDTWLMRAVPGALAKNGAEAVQAVALPDGRALAVKIDDGGSRALGPVLARALVQAGIDAPVPDRLAREPVLGGGVPVGTVRPTF